MTNSTRALIDTLKQILVETELEMQPRKQAYRLLALAPESKDTVATVRAIAKGALDSYGEG